MYTRIIVALDGSDLAERVLAYVEALADKFGSAVTLFRVTAAPGSIIADSGIGAEPVGAGLIDPTPIIEAEQQEAAEYLAAAAGRMRSRGFEVDCEQPQGPAAELIVQRAQEMEADLIAMTTHGRGGLGRLVFGSVADEVLRTAPCPVLLVRVTEAGRKRVEVPII
jgi:nucleotide-binding universal stress UspA family protein